MSGRPVGSIGILARTEFLRTTGVAAGRAIQRCITARIPAATMCGVLWSLRRPGRLRRRCRSESLNSASTRPSAKADPRAHSSFRRHARRAGRWSLTRSRSKTHSPSVSPSTRLIVCHAPSGSSWRVRRRSRLARSSCSHAATTDPGEERRAEQWLVIQISITLVVSGGAHSRRWRSRHTRAPLQRRDATGLQRSATPAEAGAAASPAPAGRGLLQSESWCTGRRPCRS
jgi:hypothetical protein